MKDWLSKTWFELSFLERLTIIFVCGPLASLVLGFIIGLVFKSSTVGFIAFILSFVWLSGLYWMFFDRIYEGVLEKGSCFYYEIDADNRWKYAIIPSIVTTIIFVFSLFSLVG